MKGEFDDNFMYLCYGDTIMLYYTRKMYSSDFQEQVGAAEDKWEGESLDEARQDLMDDEGRKERVKLQKLIEKPEHVYKGMVYSDGILDKSLKIIPKESEDDTLNAKCQFKKCLFRVEIFDNCTYHMLYKKQVAKVQATKEQREIILEQNDY